MRSYLPKLAASATIFLVLSACAVKPHTDTQSQIEASQQVLAHYDAQAFTTHKNDWYTAAQAKLSRQLSAVPFEQRGKAKNVILFVGDGMGVSTVTAARILAGQLQGHTGEENILSFEHFPFTGLSKTYNTDHQVADSAGTMSAMATGIKTRSGVLSVDETVQRGHCQGQQGHEALTSLELAELGGLKTGVVTTARITHATPAANYAKVAHRGWENNSDLPKEANNCTDIALQLIEFKENLQERYPDHSIDGIEVTLGGGRRNFLPNNARYNSTETTAPKIEGKRTDGRHLINEWLENNPDGHYVASSQDWNALPKTLNGPLLGLFQASHMRYSSDRTKDVSGEPTLAEMTQKAIETLQAADTDNKGFFLVVEGGRIDHAHHAGNAYNALHDTIALADAVAIADKLTSDKETLLIVTADHSHVMTMAGYPQRGNPILGLAKKGDKPLLDKNKKPYTTLGYQNGRGFHYLGDETDADAVYNLAPFQGRTDLAQVNVEAPGFHQESLVSLGGETHGGEDVGIYAKGPGATLLSGVHEQNYIFHVIEFSLNLVQGAAQSAHPSNR